MENGLAHAYVQRWCNATREGSYRYPKRWLEERGAWLKKWTPKRASIEDILNVERGTLMMEATCCREGGFSSQSHRWNGE